MHACTFLVTLLTFQVNVIWQCTQSIDAAVSTTKTASTAAAADFSAAILYVMRMHKRSAQ
jgi:hypothetical protein